MKLAELRDDHRSLTLTNRFAQSFCGDLFLGRQCARRKAKRRGTIPRRWHLLRDESSD